MEFSWLEAFIALAEEPSIRAAASRIGVSPATLSGRISALESHLGIALFIRGAKGSVLSERGAIYLPKARQILSRWQAISDEVRVVENTPTHFLRLAYQTALPPTMEIFISHFLEKYNWITPQFYNDLELGIRDGLMGGKADVYFVFAPEASQLEGIAHRTVYRTQLCALVPGNHRLAWKESVSLADLDGETLLLPPETRLTTVRSFELNVLRQSGIRYFLIDGRLSPALKHMLVSMNRGIILQPKVLCNHIPSQLAILPLSDPSCRCNVEMLYLKDNTNPALQQFLEDLGDLEGGDVE